MLHALMLLSVTLQVVMLLSVRLSDVIVPTTVRLEKLPLLPLKVVAVTVVPVTAPVSVPPDRDRKLLSVLDGAYWPFAQLL